MIEAIFCCPHFSQSFKVRSSYIEQLRNLNIISTHFLPAFLRLLRLDEGLIKAFKLDIWAIDEYYIERELYNISTYLYV